MRDLAATDFEPPTPDRRLGLQLLHEEPTRPRRRRGMCLDSKGDIVNLTCYDGKLNVQRWQTLHAVFGNSTWRLLQNTRHSSSNDLKYCILARNDDDEFLMTHHPPVTLIVY